MGCPVVIGFKTFETLPPLPGRFIYIDQRDTDAKACLKKLAGLHPGKDIWIAGGTKTYQKYMPFVERFYISKIDYDGPADSYFPIADIIG